MRYQYIWYSILDAAGIRRPVYGGSLNRYYANQLLSEKGESGNFSGKKIVFGGGFLALMGFRTGSGEG